MTTNPGTPKTLARLIGVTKSYGDLRVLGPIEFEINAGEKVAIIGSSGAGKTTLLKVLAGEIEASTGTVELDSQTVGSIPSRKRSKHVGLMHQQFDLVPQLSARRNIEIGNSGRWSLLRTIAGLILPVQDVRSGEIAEQLVIEKVLDERTSRLSGGQQQRVAMARLIVQSPNLLLADEPVSSLDPTLAEKSLQVLCNELSEDKNGQRAVVVNLHTPSLAVQHFDRIIGLAEGQIKFDKPSESVTNTDLSAVYSRSEDEPELSDDVINSETNWGRD
jgi:phosphonate transport system ATP-binding protein